MFQRLKSNRGERREKRTKKKPADVLEEYRTEQEESNAFGRLLGNFDIKTSILEQESSDNLSEKTDIMRKAETLSTDYLRQWNAMNARHIDPERWSEIYTESEALKARLATLETTGARKEGERSESGKTVELKRKNRTIDTSSSQLPERRIRLQPPNMNIS